MAMRTNKRQRTLFEYAEAAAAARSARAVPVVIDLEEEEQDEEQLSGHTEQREQQTPIPSPCPSLVEAPAPVPAPVPVLAPAPAPASLKVPAPASLKVPACPICGLSLSGMDLHLRELHCDRCADAPVPLAKSSVPKPSRDRQPRPRKPLPPLPNVKKIHFRDFSIVVDGFNFAESPPISQYFLSHFHADHYIGLKKSWNQGAIYCSAVTARLLSLKFKVPPDIIVELPLDTPFEISHNVSVVCFDANHCPGATVFLFRETDVVDRSRTRQWILHTGDFRSNNALIDRIIAYTHNEPIHKVYLDTTYMYPSYHFPMQRSVLQVTAEFAGRINDVGTQKLFNDRQASILNFVSSSLSRRRHLYNYVFVVGTYTIGKEKLAIAIAQFLGTKIFLPKDTPKDRIVRIYEHLLPTDILTNDITQSCVHLVPMRTLSSKDSLLYYFKPIAHIYKDMIAFSPTGWTFSNGGRFVKLYETIQEKLDHTQALLNNDNVDCFDNQVVHKQYKPLARFQVFKVPYSEHSSFKDLANFCIRIPWVQMIPTVNTHDEYMVKQMKEWFTAWKRLQKTCP